MNYYYTWRDTTMWPFCTNQSCVLWTIPRETFATSQICSSIKDISTCFFYMYMSLRFNLNKMYETIWNRHIPIPTIHEAPRNFSNPSGSTTARAPSRVVPRFMMFPTARQVLMHFFTNVEAFNLRGKHPTVGTVGSKNQNKQVKQIKSHMKSFPLCEIIPAM